jgi:hypothetical protein
MALFVNILGDGPSHDGDARRLVRSHVMKSFRQKEREASRLKWNAACKVMAGMPCGPEKSQFIRLGRGRRGTEESQLQVSELATPPGDALDLSQNAKVCEKPIAISRHVSKLPNPRNERRISRRKAIQSSHLDAPRSPTAIAQSCKMYLTENISGPLRSPEAYRQQLMLTFLELHYSAAMPDLHLAFPKMQARLNSPQTSILTLATDAVLLHALAVSKEDDSLLWAARRKNNEAIAGLRTSLRTSQDCTSDEMLLTTDALAFFDATSSTAWKHHANGLAALIETRGPRIYDTMGLLLHAPMLQLLMDALLWRGPFKFGEEQWLTAMLPTCQTRMNRLLYLGCQVPDVVKRTDKYLSQAQDVQGTTDFDSVMDSITALERNLHDWLSDWYLADFQSKPPYTNTTTTTATARAEALDVGLPSPLHPPPLSGTFTFPSLREAFAHNIFWTLLLALQQARHTLHTNSPSTPATTLTASLQATTSTANSLLCTATFVLRSVVSLPGGLACSAGPLIVAGRWYAFCDREGERQCREWCEEIVEVVIEGGKRPAGWITRSCAAWITAAL